MRNVLDTVEKVLARDASVLIAGESGSGKTHLAESIHACSPRRSAPFVHIDCASIPADLFESELFGHERGTFTDAHARKLGKLEAAGAGSVYFDELASLTPQLQAKLLRAIETRRFSRLGGSSSIAFEARILSSTTGDLQPMLQSGALRSDLYYRLNVVTVLLPPLRERPEDIVPMAREHLRRLRGRLRGFEPEAERLLRSYPWPGNVRELRNAVERAALIETGEKISASALPVSSADLVVTAARAAWTLDELESHYIAETLRVTRQNYSRAAAILGINRKTLLEKRKKYGLD
jgi:DNA-binding NtrC family response regulator